MNRWNSACNSTWLYPTEHKTKVYCIDGLDGSGKETITTELCRQLHLKNKTTILVAFPMYDKWHSFLVKLYLGGWFGKDPSKDNPYIASIFYAVDRFFGYRKYIKQHIGKVDYIILDRYATSSMIYQSSKSKSEQEAQKLIKYIELLEYKIFRIKKPDRVFVLMTDVKQSIKNIDTRGDKTDIHETEGFLTKVKNKMDFVIRYCDFEPIETMNDGVLRKPFNIVKEIMKKVGYRVE